MKRDELASRGAKAAEWLLAEYLRALAGRPGFQAAIRREPPAGEPRAAKGR